MQNNKGIRTNVELLILGFYVISLLTYCSEPSNNAIKQKQEIEADNLYLKNTNIKVNTKSDSINKIPIDKNTTDKAYSNLVISADKDFRKSVKNFDKETGEDNFLKLTRILKRHNTTFYSLYIELSEIKKNAVSIARASGVETRADGKERKLSNYFSVLQNEIRVGQINFQKKYGFDNRLLQVFENNYCFCYSNKVAVYCNDGGCVLVNGEFWQ